MLCSAVAVAMPTMTIASTNPAGTTAPTATDTKSLANTTDAGVKPPNGFTPDGLGTITSTNKNQASKPSTSTTNGNIESPQTVKNADLEEAVENCPVAEEQPQAIEDAVQAAMVVPDIDGMFNKVTKEAEGCFANSGEVINLAMMIKVPTFNGGIGTAVNTALERIIKAKAEEAKQKFCTIADAAIVDTLGPVQKYLQEYQARSAELSGITGNVGDARDPSYDKVLGTFGTKINEAEIALNKQGQIASQKAEQANQILEGIKNNTSASLEGAIKGTIDSDIAAKVAQATGNVREVPVPAGAKNTVSTNTYVPTTPSSSSSSSTATAAKSSTAPAPASSSSTSTASRNAFANPNELKNSPF